MIDNCGSVEYYKPRELAELLKVSVKTISNWTQSFRLPGQIKCGHLWRYRKDSIDKALRSGNLLLPPLKKVA